MQKASKKYELQERIRPHCQSYRCGVNIVLLWNSIPLQKQEWNNTLQIKSLK